MLKLVTLCGPIIKIVNLHSNKLFVLISLQAKVQGDIFKKIIWLVTYRAGIKLILVYNARDNITIATLMNAAKKLKLASIPNFNFEKNINKFVFGLIRKIKRYEAFSYNYFSPRFFKRPMSIVRKSLNASWQCR